MKSRKMRLGAIASLVLTSALVLTGCSTPATEAVQVEGIPTKTIGVWQSQASGDGQKQTLSAIQAATDAVGWTTVVTDSNGDPKAMAATMQSLISQKVDAILTVYVASGIITPQLQAANDAGIPVISVGYQGTPSDNITAEYAPDQAAQAGMLIDRMAEDLPNGGSVAPLSVPGYYGLDQELAILEEKGPEAGFEPLEPVLVPVTDIFGGTTSAAVDVLNANPDLAAIMTALDIGVQATVPALEQTGRDVPIYGFGAIPAALGFVRSGGVTIVTSDGAKAGFIAIDALLSYWINDTPIPTTTPDEYAFEYKIVDESNAPVEGEEAYPEGDFAKVFLDKWKTEHGI